MLPRLKFGLLLLGRIVAASWDLPESIELCGTNDKPCPQLGPRTFRIEIWTQRHAFSCANIIAESGVELSPWTVNQKRTKYAPDPWNTDLGMEQCNDARVALFNQLPADWFDFAASSVMTRAIETALMSVPRSKVFDRRLYPIPDFSEHRNPVPWAFGGKDMDNLPQTQAGSRKMLTHLTGKEPGLHWRDAAGDLKKTAPDMLLDVDYGFYGKKQEFDSATQHADHHLWFKRLTDTYVVEAYLAATKKYKKPELGSTPIRLYFAGHSGYFKGLVEMFQKQPGYPALEKFGSGTNPPQKPVNTGVYVLPLMWDMGNWNIGDGKLYFNPAEDITFAMRGPGVKLNNPYAVDFKIPVPHPVPHVDIGSIMSPCGANRCGFEHGYIFPHLAESKSPVDLEYSCLAVPKLSKAAATNIRAFLNHGKATKAVCYASSLIEDGDGVPANPDAASSLIRGFGDGECSGNLREGNLRHGTSPLPKIEEAALKAEYDAYSLPARQSSFSGTVVQDGLLDHEISWDYYDHSILRRNTVHSRLRRVSRLERFSPRQRARRSARRTLTPI